MKYRKNACLKLPVKAEIDETPYKKDGFWHCPYCDEVVHRKWTDCFNCRRRLHWRLSDENEEDQKTADRQEIIKAFEEHIKGDCPSDGKGICRSELMEKVLSLLKEPNVVKLSESIKITATFGDKEMVAFEGIPIIIYENGDLVFKCGSIENAHDTIDLLANGWWRK